MQEISLAIIEDDTVVQESLETFFKLHPEIQVVSVTSSVEDFLNQVNSLNKIPKIFLLDINLKGMSGLKGIPLIKKELPNSEIIMLTTFEETNSIFKALTLGACSYMSKRTSLQKILEAILIVNNGGSYMSPAIARKIVNYYKPKKTKQTLTKRQKDIVDGIVAGKSYKMIAADLFVSIDTVRSHIKNIYKTLEIHSKAELIRKSFDNEL